ncbi:MAG TPA: hypothetical protein VF980_08265, partial [Thermoanaerobaculia bacterium]
VSFDDGDHWQSLQMNLPVTSIRDIDVHGDDVVIATHGRAFWILDNVTPLRQSTDVTGDAYLFVPATAYRERPAGFTGSPWPKDEALAPNPPMGAYIDYVIRSASQPVTIEILDANDQLVRRYSSSDKVPVADPAKLKVAPEWFVPPSSISTSPGMHRFIWPLRYPAPAALDEAHKGAFADGVWAPPGNYKVVLTVNGTRYTQPLNVVADPRVSVSASAYAEQFALARQIESTRAPVHAALTEAGELVKTVTDEPMKNRITEMTDVVPEEQWYLAPRTTTSLRFLDSELAKLADAVDGSDAAPSADAREGYAKAKPLAEAAVKAWTEFRGTVK